MKCTQQIADAKSALSKAMEGWGKRKCTSTSHHWERRIKMSCSYIILEILYDTADLLASYLDGKSRWKKAGKYNKLVQLHQRHQHYFPFA